MSKKQSEAARIMDGVSKSNGSVRETIFSKELPPFKLKATDPKSRELQWTFTPQEKHLAEQCAQRLADIAASLGAVDPKIGKVDKFTITMDLLCVHCNCVRLNLWQLLACGADDFTHDVLGIGMTIDRTTGQLRNGFKPRCAVAAS